MGGSGATHGDGGGPAPPHPRGSHTHTHTHKQSLHGVATYPVQVMGMDWSLWLSISWC